ncbi:hypothetical protein OO009_06875 [Flavobacteriaceae bacterium KMM 6897]|nr:hypothetical protein [Flavobacteriaceae bacterium KMM 6897]MEB8345410.1 hypothetical protein [Flavobacteriaceae bacterium KMM 6898]
MKPFINQSRIEDKKTSLFAFFRNAKKIRCSNFEINRNQLLGF